MTSDFTVAVVGQSLVKRDLRGVREARFAEVTARIKAADLAFTNFEGTIQGAQGGWPTKPGYYGAVGPWALDMLAEFGFSALSLANNHAFDLGPGGVLSTLEEVGRRNFLAAGLGVDATAAARPGFRDIVAGRMALVAMDCGPMAEQSTAKDATPRVPARPGVNPLRIRPVVTVPEAAFAALREIEQALGHRARRGLYRKAAPADAPGMLDFYGTDFRLGAAARRTGEPDAADLTRTLAAIADAKRQARFVIAYLHHHHWEAVWEDVPSWMRDVARACIEAGADMVASHGVPIVQGIELHRRRPIFYSLGNFIFHSFDPTGWHHDDIWRSVIATCRFDASGDLAQIVLEPIVLGGEAALREGRFADRDVPMMAAGDVPMMAAGDGPGVLARLADLSAAFGTRIAIRDGKGDIRP